ncbi:hypothetical protein FRACYDRAFT_195934 [Fragilariopsis cylindrus CCMP1102]|uniref:Uncharacterized protein n=1 Tax=Fragilariopsis cylindrus CCMP1102 TaxID=635003 RepID=A0A1E7ESP2_9STRA|nr:hypothetical protein FRACYDRAFT_195934 [Fragilariopsis cylindrus CCMP1102]|eukprot:OEU08866.1 hypothetical protein FRACYDRAFT_195934 [Fragilariopsis cylindrus CCMP1102]
MSRLDALRQDFVPGSSSISEAIEPETETVSSSSSSSSETVSTASLTAAASTAAATAASASTTSTTTTTTTINSNKKNITVGAYYYPWHNDDFHNDQGYLRAKLYPQQGPELGEYDDTEKYTIQQHIKFSDIGNINLWVTSWWGPERIEDITTQDTIMNLVEKENHPLKIALLYETTNRLTIDGEWALNADRVQSDIEYIQKEYFDQYTNSYYMIDGKPVIFIYLARKLERFGDYTKNESLLQRTVALMRETATQDIYVVGDHGFDPYPDDRMSDKAGLFNSSLLALDAISNYDIYGSVVGSSGNMYPGKERLDSYYFEHQRTWKAVAADFGCAYIPSVKPGYNDKGVRLDAMKTPLSRRLTPDSPEGSFFDASLERAMQLIDANADNLLMVTSFNEWHEDTQIEPVELEVETTEPYDLTTGLAYVGYGTLYLDILKNATTQYNSFSEYSIEYNVNNNV